MSTFITTPATLWVVPTTPRIVQGTFPLAEPCNTLIMPPDDETLEAECLTNVVQNQDD